VTTKPAQLNWTERRLEVMELILQGFGPSQISKILGVTYGTAATHIDHVLELSGCSSRSEMQAREIERLRQLVRESA